MKLSFAVAALVAGLSLPSQAFAARIFVSSKGADAAGCGATSKPCRTFQYAHNIAPAASEIDVMDGGDYGPVSITKAISIVNDSAGVASISVAKAGAAGVYVGAGATDHVYLRGLTIDGARVGDAGVYFASGRSLTVRDSTFQRMVFAGMLVRTAANTTVDIQNVTASDNAVGIHLTGAGVILASISDTRANRNTHGVLLQPTGASARVIATITGGEANNNFRNGYIFDGGAGSTNLGAVGTLKGVTASRNASGGVAAWQKVRLSLSGANIVGNGVGVDNVRSTVTSYKNNAFIGNGSDGAFTTTSLK